MAASTLEHDLELLIDEGRISTPFRDDEEPLEQLIWRVHERDASELQVATARAQGLRSIADQGGMIQLDKTGAGFGDSRDLQDLLMYLTHAVCHFSSAFRRTREGKLIHPCMAWEGGWHMSWQRAKMRTDRPMSGVSQRAESRVQRIRQDPCVSLVRAPASPLVVEGKVGSTGGRVTVM